MKGLAITNKGVEDVCAREIKELTGAKTKILDSCVEFDLKKLEDLFLLCYKAQSPLKILFLFDYFRIKSVDDIKNHIPDLSEWVKGSTFVVRCWNNNESINTMEVEQETGGFIIDRTGAKVDLKSPGMTFFVFINSNDCYLGIDFSGEDLGKRDYRLFTGSDVLKATIAYSLARIGGFKEGETMLDPFCFSGTIPIEEALFASGFPVNHFCKDKLLFTRMKRFEDYDFNKFFDGVDAKIKKKIEGKIFAIDEAVNAVTAAKKNAKIAGINKLLSFSRKETGWLELKFKKGSVDKIITHPPEIGRRTPEPKAVKLYEELFWQADHIMKKDGLIVILTRSPKQMINAAEKHKFSVKEERSVMQGKQEFTALVFSS